MDRWRDSLTLAVTVGSWQQVSALLDAVAQVLPGFASWLVANAVPRSTVVSSSELPDHVECARRLHRSLVAWTSAMGNLGLHLGLTDNAGNVRTVGTWVEGNRVTAAMKLGENVGVDATQLPYGLHPFTAEAPDGSVWLPFRDQRTSGFYGLALAMELGLGLSRARAGPAHDALAPTRYETVSRRAPMGGREGSRASDWFD